MYRSNFNTIVDGIVREFTEFKSLKRVERKRSNSVSQVIKTASVTDSLQTWTVTDQMRYNALDEEAEGQIKSVYFCATIMSNKGETNCMIELLDRFFCTDFKDMVMHVDENKESNYVTISFGTMTHYSPWMVKIGEVQIKVANVDWSAEWDEDQMTVTRVCHYLVDLFRNVCGYTAMQYADTLNGYSNSVCKMVMDVTKEIHHATGVAY